MRGTSSKSPPYFRCCCRSCVFSRYLVIIVSLNKPTSCSVVGCAVRRGQRTKYLWIQFVSIPRNPRGRALWVTALPRKDWKPGRGASVCGRHFVSGRPSDSPDDVDYKPTLLLKGYKPVKPPTARALRAGKRVSNSYC
jgi:hypothetical protein